MNFFTHERKRAVLSSLLEMDITNPKCKNFNKIQIEKNMKLLATLFLFMATNLWAESCKEFFKSETLLKEVSILNELNKEGLLWKGFDLSNELVIFTDVKKFPRCFALYKNLRIISEVETNEGIDIPNGIYNFFHPYNRPKLERLGSELKKHDANFSMLVSLHSWEPVSYTHLTLPTKCSV